jgi:hypothetical protein
MHKNFMLCILKGREYMNDLDLNGTKYKNTMTNTSIYCGSITKGFIHTTVLQLFTIGTYGFTIHRCCRSNTLVNLS